MWLCIMLWLCIHSLILCIRHHYGIINMTQYYAGINLWPDDVHQASQCSSNLCIINMARCGASMTRAMHHASIRLNATWLITLNLPVEVAKKEVDKVWRLEEEEKKKMTKIAICLVADLLYTLTMLSGHVDVVAGQSSIRKRPVECFKACKTHS